MKTESEKLEDFMKYDHEKGTLILTLQAFDGARLLQLQKALLLGIEEIGACERSGSEDYRDATFNLTWLLRALMLDESQTNVGLGGKPYKGSQTLS
jgi:hypothetical protein